MTEAKSSRRSISPTKIRRNQKSDPDRHNLGPAQDENKIRSITQHWRRQFLDHLAETSNVSASADFANIGARQAYKVRRRDPEFARSWNAALLEGYEHLELETLERLRMGTDKDDPKFDIANALRLLAIHKETITRERAKNEASNHADDEQALFASINAKIDAMRAKEGKKDAKTTPVTDAQN